MVGFPLHTLVLTAGAATSTWPPSCSLSWCWSWWWPRSAGCARRCWRPSPAPGGQLVLRTPGPHLHHRRRRDNLALVMFLVAAGVATPGRPAARRPPRHQARPKPEAGPGGWPAWPRPRQRPRPTARRADGHLPPRRGQGRTTTITADRPSRRLAPKVTAVDRRARPAIPRRPTGHPDTAPVRRRVLVCGARRLTADDQESWRLSPPSWPPPSEQPLQAEAAEAARWPGPTSCGRLPRAR